MCTLEQFCSMVLDYMNILVYDRLGVSCVAEYDGRNSLPLSFAKIDVESVQPEAGHTFHVYLGADARYLQALAELAILEG